MDLHTGRVILFFQGRKKVRYGNVTSFDYIIQFLYFSSLKDPYFTCVICKTQRLQIKVSGGLKYLSHITRHFLSFEISTIYIVALNITSSGMTTFTFRFWICPFLLAYVLINTSNSESWQMFPFKTYFWYFPEVRYKWERRAGWEREKAGWWINPREKIEVLNFYLVAVWGLTQYCSTWSQSFYPSLCL